MDARCESEIWTLVPEQYEEMAHTWQTARSHGLDGQQTRRGQRPGRRGEAGAEAGAERMSKRGGGGQSFELFLNVCFVSHQVTQNGVRICSAYL